MLSSGGEGTDDQQNVYLKNKWYKNSVNWHQFVYLSTNGTRRKVVLYDCRLPLWKEKFNFGVDATENGCVTAILDFQLWLSAQGSYAICRHHVVNVDDWEVLTPVRAFLYKHSPDDRQNASLKNKRYKNSVNGRHCCIYTSFNKVNNWSLLHYAEQYSSMTTLGWQ